MTLHTSIEVRTIQNDSSPKLKCIVPKSEATRYDTTAIYTYIEIPIDQYRIDIGTYCV